MTKPLTLMPCCVPTLFSSIVLSSDWTWRDRHGLFHDPRKMTTQHLYYTIRMIWNNFMPHYMRVGQVRLYRFCAFYTERYFAEAIVSLGRELHKRSDIQEGWASELREMAGHLQRLSLAVWEADAEAKP